MVESIDGEAIWRFSSPLTEESPSDEDWQEFRTNGNQPIGVNGGGAIGDEFVILLYDDATNPGDPWEVTAGPQPGFEAGSVLPATGVAV